MTEAILHATPRARDVLREQFRVIGLLLRWPAVGLLLMLGVATVLGVAAIMRYGEELGFHPEQLMLHGMMGLLLPIAVWRGQNRYGAGFLWTLPVDRRRHALLRVCAGWAWLMLAIALIVLWFLVLALISGADILARETLQMLPPNTYPAPGTLDPAVLRPVQWSPQPLLWLTPFTAATATYLFASSIALGLRHPLRTVLGVLLVMFAILFVGGEFIEIEFLKHAPERVLGPFFLAPYGFDTVLTARAEFLKVGTTLTTGESVIVWRGLPNVGHWAVATLLWIAAGLAAVWAAASRHRERRRH